MICPHCTVNMHWQVTKSFGLGQDALANYQTESAMCPACARMIVQLVERSVTDGSETSRRTVLPRSSSRPPCPAEVTPAIGVDYTEACLILEISPKASAALSRRCLQHVLRDAAEVKHGNLADEIDEVITSGKLPTTIADSLDAVRTHQPKVHGTPQPN